MLDPDLYKDIFHDSEQGFCVFEVLVDQSGRPSDYRFLEVNDAFERLTGLTRPVGRTALELVPDLERHWIEIYGKVALTGQSTRFAQGSAAMGRSFDVHASRIGEAGQRLVALSFTETTAQHRAEAERLKAVEALRASEHRFRTFADTAPAMLWVTEADGACSYLSSGWYAYTGQSESQGLGYGWLEAVHPGDRGEAREAFTEANRRREPFEFEHRLLHRDGTYRWVIDAGRPRFTSDGRFEGYVGSVIDIHDRKLAEDRLDLAVNSGKVGLWYCDLPFAVLQWNTQVKEHFGLPADAIVTVDTFFDRLHPEDREPTRRAIETAIAEQTTYDTHYRTVDPAGRIRSIRAIGRARYDGERPIRFDGITVDVTELVSLREAAEAANRAKDEFLAMLGHELRNPLAPILTALQLVKLRGIDAVERERAVIERQVVHLVGLVDDLLDVSRITRGRIDLHRDRVELADTVARGIELVSPLLEQQRHTLNVDVPRGLVVDGDHVRLAQVVTNLLTNAAKYTEPGGEIRIRAERDSDHVVLRVSDTGIGIDEAMLPRIFDLFVQQPQTLARSQGGLGLGLAIVRSLVALHGGTVSASSRGKGTGSEFTVRLPLAQEASAAVAAPLQTAEPGPSGARVLVVDDNEDAAAMLGTLLGIYGYDVKVAFDAPSALAEAEAFRPQFALLDIGLPVMDGFELARQIHQRPHLAQTKLVAVTGYGQAADRKASDAAGFSAHLVKPVDAKELRRLLQSLESDGS